MSHTDIRESGTCAALPLRDAWGHRRQSDWWSAQQPARTLATASGSAATRPVPTAGAW
jgi:hypothetical protein